MTTITLKIKDKTKAGRAFITMTDSLIESRIVEIVNKKQISKPSLLEQIEIGLKEVKTLKNNKVKRKSLSELLNEK